MLFDMLTVKMIIILVGIQNLSHSMEIYRPIRRVNASCACGRPVAKRRVVNGIITRYPHFAAAFVYNGRVICGGAMINDRYVLTAAHCYLPEEGMFLDLLKVVVGEYNRAKIEKSNDLKRSVTHFTRLPHYSEQRFDMALAKVDRTFDFMVPTIYPICLPQQGSILTKPVTGTVFGWGLIHENGVQAASLLRTKIRTMTYDKCLKFPCIRDEIHNSSFCGFSYNRDACQGDSGGPMVYFDDKLNREIIIGVISWGVGCAEDECPGVYTNVALFTRWIEYKTQDAIYCSN